MDTVKTRHFIGLMSGTSLDGVDGTLVCFDDTGACQIIAHHYVPFPAALKSELLALNSAGANEIERSHLLGNELARLYANNVATLLNQSGLEPAVIAAIGCHGQTIRHRPELGFTVQIGNAALLAELSGISVVADFRSRDVAANGQGAPLVPAFHRAVFAHRAIHRVVVNIGGISNLSDLPPQSTPTGFDCGPGNVLMDAWVQQHCGHSYDRDGAWAAKGNVLPPLLQALLAHPFFDLPPPKSTGRDTFNMAWLEQYLSSEYEPADVQATLLELSARSIADAVTRHCGSAEEVYLCGGGAYNHTLMMRLQALLGRRNVAATDILGIPADQVEAAAFAWLARQRLLGLPGNIPEVTGASGPRVLGAIYPA